MELCAEIAAATGRSPIDCLPLHGGCVSAVYRLRFTAGPSLIAKVDEDESAALPVEAFMLRYLAENTALPVPEVYYASERLLIMSDVPGGSHFDPTAERHAAELLAALHALSAATYGFARDTVIGGLRQPNPPTASWPAFFRDHRLRFMADEAAREGRLPAEVRGRLERLCRRLDELLPEPDRPALIHGDVWTTNVLSADGRITVFLDPAIYFAHHEVELAFTTLFGTFGREFYARYDALRPIAPGFFEARRHLYNLYPLLVHVRLFGGAYVGSVAQTLQRFGF